MMNERFELNEMELEEVVGGNNFTDAEDWLCEKVGSDDEPKTSAKHHKRRVTGR